MKLFRRMKVKYGIAHPLCMLSLLACVVLCAGMILPVLANYKSTGTINHITILETVKPEQMLSFGEEIFNTLIHSYSQVVAIGVEPFLAVLVQGVAGLLNAMFGMPFQIESTWFSVPQIFVVAFVLYCIGKFMHCFECTRSFAMLTCGEFERILGYFMMVYIACRNVLKLIYICEKHKSMLEVLLAGLPVEWIVGAFIFIIGVGSAFGGILIFYIIKTLVLGLQIMQLSVSFFPFTSLLFEVLRSGVTIAVAVFNLLFPQIGFAFNCAAFVIGVLLLAQTSSSVEYFRVIYVETLLLPYYRFIGETRLLYKDVPVEIRKKCKSQNGIIVPVFSMDKFTVDGIEIADHEKWWMEIWGEHLYFYRKKFLSKKAESFSLSLTDKKWYFKDNWRCLELFDLNGPEENIIKLFQKPEREISFAVSKEYEGIFNEITSAMGAADYNALKAKLTKERMHVIEQEKKAFYATIQ